MTRLKWARLISSWGSLGALCVIGCSDENPASVDGAGGSVTSAGAAAAGAAVATAGGSSAAGPHGGGSGGGSPMTSSGTGGTAGGNSAGVGGSGAGGGHGGNGGAGGSGPGGQGGFLNGGSAGAAGGGAGAPGAAGTGGKPGNAGPPSADCLKWCSGDTGIVKFCKGWGIADAVDTEQKCEAHCNAPEAAGDKGLSCWNKQLGIAIGYKNDCASRYAHCTYATGAFGNGVCNETK